MAVNQNPFNFRGSKLLRGAQAVQSAAKQLAADVQDRTDQFTKFPQFSTGGRAYIIVSGKPLALAQRVAWRINTAHEEIRTCDTHMGWDVVPGQVSVSVSISEIVDPNIPAEVEGTWATMASLIHQPAVELEVFDKLGERMFFARGMFVSMSSGIAMGSMAERSLEFVGWAYASNVDQQFKPYAPTNQVAETFRKASKTLRSWTGGLF